MHHHSWSPAPPLGWNSFICYGSSVTEDQFKANVDAFAARLAPSGWEYCVLDFCWSHPEPGAVANPNQEPGFQPRLACDEWGRLLPAPGRFPSSAGGRGLKPLADYVHAKGLKFGLHVMRGIPRQAVEARTPVKGTDVTAADIADRSSCCTWLNHMHGVDMRRSGAQAYYNSLFQLYAEWGVDYIKADDILTDYPGPYHAAEIEAIRGAIDGCGRPMLLSLSPGPAPVNQAAHLAANANLWRMSADFWDRWPRLKEMFYLCNAWTGRGGRGFWPDADMLPIGRLALCGPEGPPRESLFTPDEQQTMLTLWAVFRSPLMIGGDLPVMGGETLALLTNPEVLAVNQRGRDPFQLYRHGDILAWVAEAPAGNARHLALFNLADAPQPVPVAFSQLGRANRMHFRDLWARADLGVLENRYAPELPAHGSRLFTINPVQ